MGTIVTNLAKLPADVTLIFNHIPKTAGSTLDAVLDANYATDTMFTVLSPVRERLAAFRALAPEGKRSLRLIRGHGVHGLHTELAQPCVYATLLRDPLDRVVSQYYFIRNSPGHPRHAAVLERGTTLLDYLRNGVNPQADNGQVRALVEPGKDAEPDAPFGRCSADMLVAARRNLTEHYAAVGITERFDEFLVLMQRALGWRHIGYSRRKVTQRRPALDSLSTDERKALRQVNALDLELYETAVQLATVARRRQSLFFPLSVAWFRRRNARGRGA